MARRPLVEQHQEGLGPFVREQTRRQRRQERATRAGDQTITRVTVQGGSGGGGTGPTGPPGADGADGAPGFGLPGLDGADGLDGFLGQLASPINLPERATQALAAGDLIVVTESLPLTPFTTASAIVSTAVPLIAPGRPGQLAILRNDNGVAGRTLTIRDTNVAPPGSGLRLTADTIALADGSLLGLIYCPSLGWVEQYYLALKHYDGAISSFTVDGAGALTHEWGDGSTANDTAPVFLAAYTGIPTVASVTITVAPDAGYPWTIPAPYTGPSTGPQYFRSATRNGTRTFRLSATVNGSNLTADVIVTYRAPNYYGVSTLTTLTGPQLVALSRVLDTDPFATYSSLVATGGNYVWFGFVDNDAVLDTNLFFAIGGERAKFSRITDALSVTGTYLKVAAYETFRSDLAGMGTVTVVVQAARPPTKRYIGKVGQATQLSEAQIEALQLSDLTESPNGTFASITGLGAGDYLWWCVSDANIAAPAHYGISPDGGASGYQEASFTAMAVVSVTNIYGYTENYKDIHSNVTGFQAVNINNHTTTTWSLKTQAAAFANRVYMGAHADTAITSAHVLALDDDTNGSSNLSGIAGTYTVTIPAGKYLWFCWPASLGAPAWGFGSAHIKDGGGFDVAGAYQADISQTNDFGVTETYKTWRSDNMGIFPSGQTITVTV